MAIDNGGTPLQWGGSIHFDPNAREEIQGRIDDMITKLREGEAQKRSAADDEQLKRLALVAGKGLDLASRVVVLAAAKRLPAGSWKQSLVIGLGLAMAHTGGWLDGLYNPRWDEMRG